MKNPDKDKPESLCIKIEAALNGGFIAFSNNDVGLINELIGAYSSGADLIRAMPELLGLDGLYVECHSSSVLGRQVENVDLGPPSFKGSPDNIFLGDEEAGVQLDKGDLSAQDRREFVEVNKDRLIRGLPPLQVDEFPTGFFTKKMKA